MHRIEYELPYRLDEQLALVLRALGAIAPVATEAGISTADSERYDEWEGLVEAIFFSFLILPIENTSTVISRTMFAYPGFDYDAREPGLIYFGGTVSGKLGCITDIVSQDGQEFSYLVESPNSHSGSMNIKGHEIHLLNELGLYS